MASCHTHAANQTIFPQNSQNSQKFLLRYSPTEFTEHTETTGARYSPTDCTDVHRLGGYGILPYPRSYKTIFPQKPTQPNHL